MKLTGHKTESVYRRYAIVSEADLSEGLEKLARLHETERNPQKPRTVTVAATNCNRARVMKRGKSLIYGAGGRALHVAILRHRRDATRLLSMTSDGTLCNVLKTCSTPHVKPVARMHFRMPGHPVQEC